MSSTANNKKVKCEIDFEYGFGGAIPNNGKESNEYCLGGMNHRFVKGENGWEKCRHCGKEIVYVTAN